MSTASPTSARLRPPVLGQPDQNGIGRMCRTALRTILLFAAAVTTVAGAATMPAAAAAPAGAHLQFANSGKCITDPRWSTTVGQRLDQFTCVSPSQTNQQWILHPVPNHSGWYLIQNAYSAQCMDIENHSADFGAHVIQSPCKYDNSAQWFKKQFSGRTVPFTYYLLQNGHSSLCLNVEGGSTANGASIIQWPCDNSKNNEQIRFWIY